jgi:hypothetical protein
MTDKNAKFTLTLILSHQGRGWVEKFLSHSPYPSGSKSSLDACPPFRPEGEGIKN